MIDIVSLLKLKKQKKTAGEVAKERLKLVLIHDRSNCESDLLENIKKDIMEVLSKYMEIDMEALDIKIDTVKSEDGGEDEVPALYANIPIKNLKKHENADETKKTEEDKKEDKDKKDKDNKDKKDDKGTKK